MAREYYRKSCKISRGVYYQVKGILMDYDKLIKERMDILYGSQFQISGMPHSGGDGDQTERKALKMAYLDSRLEAVDQAAELMRGERGERVPYEFDPIKAYWSYDYFNCQHFRSKERPNGPCRRTWNNFKDRFSEAIAKYLNLF